MHVLADRKDFAFGSCLCNSIKEQQVVLHDTQLLLNIKAKKPLQCYKRISGFA